MYFCFEKEEETKKEERKKKEKENRKRTENQGNEKSREGCANIPPIKSYGVQFPALLVMKRKSIKTDLDYQKQIDRSLVVLVNTEQIPTPALDQSLVQKMDQPAERMPSL